MGHFRNISPDERRRLDEFRQERLWQEWTSTLHPSTRRSYASGLFTLLGRLQLTPRQLKDLAENPETQKALSTQVKILFGQLKQEYSFAARNIMLAALKNFLALNEIELPLTGFKLKTERTLKPLFTWEDAERTVSKANIEYQPLFQFLLWSTFDLERFTSLNGDPERLQEIKEQLKDKAKDWIKIDVPHGRKQSPPFYALVPREIAGLLPILDQEGKPIISKNAIFYQWRNALRRAGFQFKHFGPHNLRSSWTGEATVRKLEPVVRQHQLGHDVDSENYQRMQRDETWVTEQFREAWATEETATTDDLKERDSRIAKLEAMLSEPITSDDILKIFREHPEIIRAAVVKDIRESRKKP
jgi:hypothetical protein